MAQSEDKPDGVDPAGSVGSVGSVGSADRMRMTISIGRGEMTRLKEAATSLGMPVATMTRAFIEHGLDHLYSDEVVAQTVQDAAELERRRRVAAGSVGGRAGARSKARQIDEELARAEEDSR